MEDTAHSNPYAVVERLHNALNRHDLEAFLACFAPGYRSEQPVHRDRAFQGREQVRKNWSRIFAEMPDFQSEILGVAVVEDNVWTEWHWQGTWASGERAEWRGVTIFQIQDNQIASGRLYMELVQGAGEGIDAAVTRMVRGSD